MTYRQLVAFPKTAGLCSGVALLIALGVARTAAAQEACGETTCPKGFTCETTTAGCPLIDCGDAADCEPCTPEETSYCAPAPCTSDESCDQYMVCAEIEECSGAVEQCAEGEECTSVAPECTTTSRQCVPRWQLPCTTAADCGQGFTCEEEVACGCSGSSGAVVDPAAPVAPDDPATGSAGAAAVAEPPVEVPVDEDCSCEATGVMQCQAIETACSSAMDCPTDWTCEDNREGACWSDANGNSGCTPADPPKLCVPPYSSLSPTAIATDAVALEEGATAGEPADPAAPATDDAAEPGATDASVAGGGCSVASPPAAAPPLGMLLVGLIGMLGVRRRTAARP